MNFFDWTRSFFNKDTNSIEITAAAFEQKNELDIKNLALSMAISFIASTISKCEFKTYLNSQEVKGDEYYLWNVEPNVNQNASQLIQDFITNLLYNGEALIVEVNGQLIVADSFTQNEYAVVPNTFSDVISGTMSFNKTFNMQDVIYLKMDNPQIRQLIENLINGYNKVIDLAVGKYRRSNGKKGIMHIDTVPKGDKDFKQKLNDLLTTQFKSFFESENAVIHLPKGFNYEDQPVDTSKKSTSDVVDISSLVKDAFSKASQAFRIPPAILLGDVANADSFVQEYFTFCVDPIVMKFRQEINRKRYGKNGVLKGSYLRIDTTCLMHIDIFSIADKIDKLIASGMYSIDGLREKIGDTMLNTDWSQKHWITKNYSEINQIENSDLKGGDTSGKNDL